MVAEQIRDRTLKFVLQSNERSLDYSSPGAIECDAGTYSLRVADADVACSELQVQVIAGEQRRQKVDCVPPARFCSIASGVGRVGEIKFHVQNICNRPLRFDWQDRRDLVAPSYSITLSEVEHRSGTWTWSR